MLLPLLVTATAGWVLAVVLWVVAAVGIVSGFGSWSGHRFRRGLEVAIVSWLSFPVVALAACAASWTLWGLSVPGAGYVLLLPFVNGIVYVAMLATAYGPGHPVVTESVALPTPRPAERPPSARPARTPWPSWAVVPTLAEAERALDVWRRWAVVHRPSYVDSVVGEHHVVEIDLPADALECVRRGRRDPAVDDRYAEPMCALRDGDWELPGEIEAAYADVRNLFVSLDPEAPADEDAAMDLRPELCSPTVDPARVAELSAEILRIEQLLQEGEGEDDPVAAEAIARFNAATGSEFEPWDFVTFYGSRDEEEFAREAAWPPCPLVEDVTRDELIEVVRRSRTAGDDARYYVMLFSINASALRMRLEALERRGERDPANEPRSPLPADPRADLTPDQEVDAALRYRPIAL